MNTYVLTRPSKGDWWLVCTDCPPSRFHSLLIDYLRAVSNDKEPPFTGLDYIRSKGFDAKELRNSHAIEYLNRNNLKKRRIVNLSFPPYSFLI